jgi:hypothetical protein
MKEFMKKIGAGIVAGLKLAGAWSWEIVKKYRSFFYGIAFALLIVLILKGC